MALPAPRPFHACPRLRGVAASANPEACPSCAQLASRAARSEAAPSYLLQLVSSPAGGGPPRTQLLECDLATLRAVSAAADAALRAADGPHARRLRRQLK